jgi:peptidoglycan/LPS O-acetylase OafA/YrhL
MLTKKNTNTENNYFNFIDILRFLVITLSFLHHSNVIYFLYGHTFFFVLSGFILTFQANKEVTQSNFFSWRKFTMRRILRIFPLYFSIVFMAYMIPYFIGNDKITLAPIQYYLTFTSNYYSQNHIFILMILWSVAVQEQFYLFISVCYKFGFKYLNHIAIILILLSCTYKYYSSFYDIDIYFHTLNHCSSFGIGIILANLYHQGKILNYKFVTSQILLIFSILFLLFASSIDFPYWEVLDNLVVSMFFAYILFFLCSLNHLIKENLLMKLLQKMGQFSYGMYCLQGVVITFGTLIVSKNIGINSKFTLVFINYMMLVFSAFVSYRFLEKPFLRLKNHFRA